MVPKTVTNSFDVNASQAYKVYAGDVSQKFAIGTVLTKMSLCLFVLR